MKIKAGQIYCDRNGSLCLINCLWEDVGGMMVQIGDDLIIPVTVAGFMANDIPMLVYVGVL